MEGPQIDLLQLRRGPARHGPEELQEVDLWAFHATHRHEVGCEGLALEPRLDLVPEDNKVQVRVEGTLPAELRFEGPEILTQAAVVRPARREGRQREVIQRRGVAPPAPTRLAYSGPSRICHAQSRSASALTRARAAPRAPAAPSRMRPGVDEAPPGFSPRRTA